MGIVEPPIRITQKLQLYKKSVIYFFVHAFFLFEYKHCKFTAWNQTLQYCYSFLFLFLFFLFWKVFLSFLIVFFRDQFFCGESVAMILLPRFLPRVVCFRGLAFGYPRKSSGDFPGKNPRILIVKGTSSRSILGDIADSTELWFLAGVFRSTFSSYTIAICWEFWLWVFSVFMSLLV